MSEWSSVFLDLPVPRQRPNIPLLLSTTSLSSRYVTHNYPSNYNHHAMSYYIQDAISQRTRESSFITFFPALHHLDWNLISADMQRRNCLETLGDAVMSLSITNLLQKLLPDRSLQVYSVSDIFPSQPSASSKIPMI